VDEVRSCRVVDALVPQEELAPGQQVGQRVICEVSVNADACPAGRRPAGLGDDLERFDDAGAYFARAARLEAESVQAFVELARELDAHRAPPALVDGCLRAAAEERRHARVMSALARARGVAPRSPRPSGGGIRPLETIARHNAVEGCGRETFGALHAAAQAASLPRAAERAALRGVARDEASHAALSWAIHRWAGSRIGAHGRRRVAAELEETVAALWQGVASSDDAHARRCGLPDGDTCAQLLGALAPAWLAA
jgi:hypothetical protein